MLSPNHGDDGKESDQTCFFQLLAGMFPTVCAKPNPNKDNIYGQLSCTIPTSNGVKGVFHLILFAHLKPNQTSLCTFFPRWKSSREMPPSRGFRRTTAGFIQIWAADGHVAVRFTGARFSPAGMQFTDRHPGVEIRLRAMASRTRARGGGT